MADDWNLSKTRHAVSRMAATLVMAAGGEIKVPLALIRQADDLELTQDDTQYGYVVYRSRHRNRTDQPQLGGPIRYLGENEGTER